MKFNIFVLTCILFIGANTVTTLKRRKKDDKVEIQEVGKFKELKADQEKKVP